MSIVGLYPNTVAVKGYEMCRTRASGLRGVYVCLAQSGNRDPALRSSERHLGISLHVCK